MPSAPFATATPASSPVQVQAPSPRPTARPTIAPSPSAEPQAGPGDFAFLDPSRHLLLWAANGETQALWERGEVTQFAWAPDGRRIAFVSESKLYLWQEGAASARVLLGAPVLAAGPSWSADGSVIAVAAAQEQANCSPQYPCELLAVDSADGSARSLGPGTQPLFAPRGAALLASALQDQPPHMREAELTQPMLLPNLEAKPVLQKDAENVMDWRRAAWSADGSLVAVSNLLLDARGNVVERLGSPGGWAGAGDPTIANGISPDGRYVALATLTITGSVADDMGTKYTTLSILNRATAERQDIWTSASEPGHGYYWLVSPVVWSPDGARLAFAGCGTAADGTAGCGAWIGAADGSRIALAPGTSDTAGAAREGSSAAQFSADGRWLSFTQWQTSGDGAFKSAIRVWRVGEAGMPRELAAGSDAAWRPQSR